jgi:hypothetical protein
MINLDKHKVTIDGEDYLPYAIVKKAYSEIYEYDKNQKKLDHALELIDNSVRTMSTLLNTTNIDDKDSTRES